MAQGTGMAIAAASLQAISQAGQNQVASGVISATGICSGGVALGAGISAVTQKRSQQTPGPSALAQGVVVPHGQSPMRNYTNQPPSMSPKVELRHTVSGPNGPMPNPLSVPSGPDATSRASK